MRGNRGGLSLSFSCSTTPAEVTPYLMAARFKQMASALRPWLTATKFGKFLISAAIATPPAAFLTLVGSCQFYLSAAKTSCNCYAERAALARLAFERDYQLTGFLMLLVDLLLCTALFLIPWTPVRRVLFIVAVVAGFVAWTCYPNYGSHLPSNTERWWPLPVVSVVAAPYSEFCRVYIVPLLSWQWGCSLLAFFLIYFTGELMNFSYLLVARSKSRKESTNGSGISSAEPVTGS